MKRIQIALVLAHAAALVAIPAFAQQYNISTVAGTPQSQGFYGDGLVATGSELDVPIAVTIDSKGNMYIVDSLTYVIRQVAAATGIINTIAGDGTAVLEFQAHRWVTTALPFPPISATFTVSPWIQAATSTSPTRATVASGKSTSVPPRP